MYKGPSQVQVVMMLENVNAKLKTLLEINVILVRQIIMDSQIAKVLFFEILVGRCSNNFLNYIFTLRLLSISLRMVE